MRAQTRNTCEHVFPELINSFACPFSYACLLYACNTKEVLFLLQISIPKSAAILFRSLPEKRRKRLSSAEFDIFVSHSGLVHDVTDTDRWAHNGSTHGRVFATFKRRF